MDVVLFMLEGVVVGVVVVLCCFDGSLVCMIGFVEFI